MKKKYFYIRINKCACRTIIHLYKDDPLMINPGTAYYQSPFDEYLKKGSKIHFNYCDTSVNTFTFIRNPYNRAVSSWKFCNLRRWNSNLDFCNFLKNLRSLLKSPIDDLNKKELQIVRHSIPQTKYLVNNGGELIVDFIGRIEFLDSHVSLLDDYLGVSPIERKITRNFKIPGIRAKDPRNELRKCDSSRPFKEEYLKYYCDESRRLVEEIYSDDVNLLGYSFGEKEPTNVFRDIKLKKLSELSALSSA